MTQFSSKELPERVSDDDKKYLKKWGDKLSDSTRRSKWIGGPDEHAEHDGQSLVTRNHEVIMKWAEERGAVPATVSGTEHGERLAFYGLTSPAVIPDGSKRSTGTTGSGRSTSGT